MKCKSVTVIVLLIIVCMSFVSCKKKQDDAQSVRKVKVLLDWTPNTNHTGLYVAQEMGYFKEEGLEVEIIQPGQNTTEKSVAEGLAQFGISYQESVTLARAENVKIKSIAAIIQHNTSGFASLKKDNILSPADFAGKKYGSSGWTSELEILKAVMTNSKADFESVKVVNGVYDFFSTIGRDADFEWIYYGWDGVRAKQQKININFIPVKDLDPVFDFYSPVIIANDDLLATEPKLARKFLKAVSKGYEYCIANPDKAAEILVKAVPELDKELVTNSMRYLKDEYKSDAQKWGEQKGSVWANFTKWMETKRILRIAVNPQDLYSNEFLP